MNQPAAGRVEDRPGRGALKERAGEAGRWGAGVWNRISWSMGLT